MYIPSPDRLLIKLDTASQMSLGDLSLQISASYEHPSAGGTVVGIGPDHLQVSGLNVGDKVLLPFHDLVKVLTYGQNMTYSFLTIDGELHVACSTYSVVAKISESLFQSIKNMSKLRVDWASQAQPVGSKVFIRLKTQQEATDSGLIIPIVSRKPMRAGVIVAVGPSANDIFEQEEFFVGANVLLPETYSGGELPYQDLSKDYIVRTNPSEILAVHDGDGWRPVGGKLFAEPYFPELERVQVDEELVVGGHTRTVSSFRLVGSTLLAPDNVKLNPTLAIVSKLGLGYSNKFTAAAAQGWDGPLDFMQEGDVILIKQTYNRNGEIVGGNSLVTIGEKHYMVLDANFVEAVLDNEVVSAFLPKHTQPAELQMKGLDNAYGA